MRERKKKKNLKNVCFWKRFVRNNVSFIHLFTDVVMVQPQTSRYFIRIFFFQTTNQFTKMFTSNEAPFNPSLKNGKNANLPKHDFH